MSQRLRGALIWAAIVAWGFFNSFQWGAVTFVIAASMYAAAVLEALDVMRESVQWADAQLPFPRQTIERQTVEVKSRAKLVAANRDEFETRFPPGAGRQNLTDAQMAEVAQLDEQFVRFEGDHRRETMALDLMIQANAHVQAGRELRSDALKRVAAEVRDIMFSNLRTAIRPTGHEATTEEPKGR